MTTLDKETKTGEEETVKDILGCVGEALAAFLPDTEDVRKAAREARAGLLDMVNENRESAVAMVVGELVGAIDYLDNTDIRSELDLDDSLNDAADKAFAHAAYIVQNDVSWNVFIDDTELG